MSEIFIHNGKHLETEEEYFSSVCENGEVRNAVSLSAARFYKKLYENLLKVTAGIMGERIEMKLKERVKS